MNTSWIDTLFYDSECQFTVESDIPKASLNEPRTDEMHTKTERLHLIISHVLYYRFLLDEGQCREAMLGNRVPKYVHM